MQVANTTQAADHFKVFSKLLPIYQQPVLTWAENIEDILVAKGGVLNEPDIDRALEDTIEQLKDNGYNDSLELFCASKENILTAAALMADMTPYGHIVRELWLDRRLARLTK